MCNKHLLTVTGWKTFDWGRIPSITSANNCVLLYEEQGTVMRKAIAVEQGVAVTLWFLATPCEYRIIVHLFGIARSTVCEIVQETCELIVHTIFHKYMHFSNGEKLSELVDGF